MKKKDYIYEPHLVVREYSIPPKGEWMPRLAGWSLIQVRQGTGYYLQPELNRELETGAVLLMARDVPGNIRASQLGTLSLTSFSVLPARLMGLITLSEQDFLEAAASRKESCLQIFPANSSVAIKMSELGANRNRDGLSFRLKLLQLFVETFGNELERPKTASNDETSDARMRLEILLKETPLSELLEMDFDDLARLTHCTVRHLSRIFQQVVGMSFRDKRADLRLARARELLATSNSKVVEVALESGYKSLSLFNLMFARRFGTTPAKWRRKQGSLEEDGNKNTRRFAPGEIGAPGFQMNPATRQARNRHAGKNVRSNGR
jgi:AraC-like DNA-binding protein